ncbi:MAG: radical SAM protein [Candidatus Omnitrophota bacterium]
MGIMDFQTYLSDRKELEYKFFPGINFVYPNVMSDKNSAFRNELMSQFDQIERHTNPVTGNDQIVRKLANVRNLLLEITDDCNLRCRYCVYSGQFPDRRHHGNSKMDWSTAEAASDFFFDWVLKHEALRTMPYWLSVGFYGGEPLLNFDLIENTVARCNKTFNEKILPLGFKSSSIGYTITTNGLLLDEQIIDFLIKNNFFITLSIDGPKEIHDRNKGKGNFDQLIRKINVLENNYPDFYRKKVLFSVVYNKDTDLQKVRDFFSQEIFENCQNIVYGYVNDYFSDLNCPAFGLNEEQVIRSILEKKKNKEPLFKIEEKILSQYFEFQFDHVGTRNIFGGYCTLGSKRMFVRVNGDLLGCERMSDSFKIGSIYSGFDLSRIMEIENDWYKNSKECMSCIVQGCCHACVGTVGYKNALNFDPYCKKARSNFFNKVKDYIEYKEIP